MSMTVHETLKAMREPSARMIEKGYDALSVEWDMSQIDAQEMCAAVRRIWQAMYDESDAAS